MEESDFSRDISIPNLLNEISNRKEPFLLFITDFGVQAQIFDNILHISTPVEQLLDICVAKMAFFEQNPTKIIPLLEAISPSQPLQVSVSMGVFSQFLHGQEEAFIETLTQKEGIQAKWTNLHQLELSSSSEDILFSLVDKLDAMTLDPKSILSSEYLPIRYLGSINVNKIVKILNSQNGTISFLNSYFGLTKGKLNQLNGDFHYEFEAPNEDAFQIFEMSMESYLSDPGSLNELIETESHKSVLLLFDSSYFLTEAKKHFPQHDHQQQHQEEESNPSDESPSSLSNSSNSFVKKLNSLPSHFVDVPSMISIVQGVRTALRKCVLARVGSPSELLSRSSTALSSSSSSPIPPVSTSSSSSSRSSSSSPSNNDDDFDRDLIEEKKVTDDDFLYRTDPIWRVWDTEDVHLFSPSSPSLSPSLSYSIQQLKQQQHQQQQETQLQDLFFDLISQLSLSHPSHTTVRTLIILAGKPSFTLPSSRERERNISSSLTSSSSSLSSSSSSSFLTPQISTSAFVFSYLNLIRIAIKHSWNVEIWGWEGKMDSSFHELSLKHPTQCRICYFDPHVDSIIIERKNNQFHKIGIQKKLSSLSSPSSSSLLSPPPLSPPPLSLPPSASISSSSSSSTSPFSLFPPSPQPTPSSPSPSPSPFQRQPSHFSSFSQENSVKSPHTPPVKCYFPSLASSYSTISSPSSSPSSSSPIPSSSSVSSLSLKKGSSSSSSSLLHQQTHSILHSSPISQSSTSHSFTTLLPSSAPLSSSSNTKIVSLTNPSPPLLSSSSITTSSPSLPFSLSSASSSHPTHSSSISSSSSSHISPSLAQFSDFFLKRWDEFEASQVQPHSQSPSLPPSN